MASSEQHDRILATLSNQDDVAQTRALVAPIVQHMCATLIQKLARGMITRASFTNLKIEYYVSSKYIQAAVRGFLTRRRVAKLYWHNAASIVLQRVARGMLARRLVRAHRHRVRVLESTLALQKVVRGHFGRVRMTKVRHLHQARSAIVAAAADASLSVSDLKELADACALMVAVAPAEAAPKPLTPLVLGLVRMLMLFTSDSDADVDVANIRWREAASYLRCSVRLVRIMKMLASAAEGRYLRPSPLGNALLDAHLADEAFQDATFLTLERGARAATAIFRWVTSFAVVTRLQTVLPAYNLGFDGPFRVASALSKRERLQNEIEANETAASEDDVARRFVPAALVQVAGYPHHRPRPVLLVIAHDVPLAAKAAIVERLVAALPGLFVVMNRAAAAPGDEAQLSTHAIAPSSSFAALREMPWTTRTRRLDWEGLSVADIRNAVRVGYNVILETDIGLTDAPQRQFLHAFSALKAAIEPSPLCVLVQGSFKNRAAVSMVMTGNSDSGDASVELARSSPHSDRPMADAPLKRAFERAAEHLFVLAQPHVAAQMTAISTVESPAIAFVVVIEAVIILLTPTKRYDGPKASTSYVSWRLGKRLLANAAFFCAKLRDVKSNDVAPENLVALDRYLRHGDWPSRTLAHALGPLSELLFALASWVEAIVHCAHVIADCEGLAPSISRTTPICGLFHSVVTYVDRSAVGGNAVAASQDAGEAACVRKLLDAVLADVQVYRASHVLDGRRCIVTVSHDCLRIYFSAYDPASSWRWHTTIAEADVDTLLAPNSIERGDVKRPPTTRADMYDRLVQLCLLQASKSSSSLREPPVLDRVAATAQTTATGTQPTTCALDKQLVVRPRAIRLYRRTLNLSGYLTTLTISELSRGRVQVDAFVHNASLGKDLRAVFGLERILERMSAAQARAWFIEPAAIPALVLDRLHLFRVAQSLTMREKTWPCPSSSPRHRLNGSEASRRQLTQPAPTTRNGDALLDRTMAMKLCIRTRETAPGRLLVRKAVRSRWLTTLWLCSVYESHTTRAYRIEFYAPQTCERHTLELTARDCEDFVVTSKHASRNALALMMKHFRFCVDAETETTVCDAPRRVLARFPWSIPVATNPHQRVHARGVVRTYVQAERLESTGAATSDSERANLSRLQQQAGRLQYRICLPDSCDEQTLTLDDSEVESYFANGSWTTASSMTERQRMSRELVKCFVWDASAAASSHDHGAVIDTAARTRRDGRVVALLPSGAVKAHVSTRITGKTKAAPAAQRPLSRIKRSPFTARSSLQDAVPLLSSCVQLLDSSGNSDTAAAVKRCYTYNAEELVHKGSYRANGVLVLVQVFMKAVVVDTLVPMVPVDRIEQHDSFVLTFRFYDPRSSASAVVVVTGRHELREVVGPDHAALICASAVHDLVQHIVERRTEVTLSPVPKVVHSQSFRGQAPPLIAAVSRLGEQADPALCMSVAFQRDRLFAKQKATPIHQSFAQDLATNATKLIDRAPERGVKVVTKTRVVRGFGRVILTVYDVGATQRRGSDSVISTDAVDAVFRIDAYVLETSARLSLVVFGSELLHVVGDRLDLLDTMALAQSGEHGEKEETAAAESKRRALELAALLIDHVGIEARHDGVTSDRLFLTDYYAPSDVAPSSSSATTLQQRPSDSVTPAPTHRTLLFKTTRSVGHDQVLVSLYVLEDCSLAVRSYVPRTSQVCETVVQQDVLRIALGFGDDKEHSLTTDALTAPSIPRLVLMTHICSFLRLEMLASSPHPDAGALPSDAALHASFAVDAQSARETRARLEAEASDATSAGAELARWSGMAVSTGGAQYFAVRILLRAASHSATRSTAAPLAVDECDAVCVAWSPSTFLGATALFGSLELQRVVSDRLEAGGRCAAALLLERVRECLELELTQVAETHEVDGSSRSVALRIRLGSSDR